MILYDELVHQAGREILQNVSRQWEKPESEKAQDKAEEPETPDEKKAAPGTAPDNTITNLWLIAAVYDSL